MAYQCDDNGYFVGTVECQRNPKRTNSFLLPKNATFSEKPNNSCNWYNFRHERWETKLTLEQEAEGERLRRENPPVFLEPKIKLTIIGQPSTSEIKEAIQKLLNML